MPTKKEYRKKVNVIMNKYMDNLRKREAYEMILLSKRWKGVMDTLETLIIELSKLPSMSANQLVRLQIYKEFMATANSELLKYSIYSTTLISATQKEFALAGMQSAFDVMGVLNVSFNKINVEAVLRMVGQTQEGSPLSEILLRRYGDNLERVVQVLIDSNALGRNPNLTARLMGKTMNTSLSDAIRIARTEQISAFRGSSIESYKESGIVSSVSLIAESDACPQCLEVESKNPYPLNHDFESDLHPNCRCSVAANI